MVGHVVAFDKHLNIVLKAVFEDALEWEYRHRC